MEVLRVMRPKIATSQLKMIRVFGFGGGAKGTTKEKRAVDGIQRDA
jgi:hypothetical protein